MTDEQHDPMAEVFNADQLAAANEARTRDEQTWTIHLNSAQADQALKQALAHRHEAAASIWNAVAFAVGFACFLAGVTWLVWGIVALVEVIR